jgi:hypothetical protein
MVSMGVKEIFPLMKLERIFDFTTVSDHRFPPLCSSFTITSSCSYVGLATMGNFLFEILTPKNICWSSPQTWFNSTRVAFSSSTKTSKKFVVAGKPFGVFFQHLSSVCPNPRQKEHLRPQLSVLCPLPHLAHSGLMFTSSGHVEMVCFHDRHN